MNEMGAAREPFLFVISYDAQRGYLWALQDIPEHVLFDFPLARRMAEPSPLPERIIFEPSPISLARYKVAFDLVTSQLRCGDSYLLNLCFPTQLDSNLTLRDIITRAKAPYRLMIEGEFCSFSPETFLRIRGNQAATYPMKGTIDASLPHARELLMESEKEASEHATIVDMLRNDLSMICANVHVPRYRYIDEIESSRGRILQTSSELVGDLPDGWHSRLGSLLARLLPAGSISGAPKRRSLEIIEEAEGFDRGFYTGVFGYFDGESLDSAVTIRYIEQVEQQLVYKSGGGITAQSELESEYEEMIHKVYVPFTT